MLSLGCASVLKIARACCKLCGRGSAEGLKTGRYWVSRKSCRTCIHVVAAISRVDLKWMIAIEVRTPNLTKKDGTMKRKSMLMIAGIVASIAVLTAGAAISAEDKYTLKLPNGLAFSEFRGYENWQVVSVSQTAELLKVEVANPTMIEAYRSGIPGNGKPFPDGSKIAKIEWKPKKMAESPFFGKRARYLAGCLSDRKRQQAISGHEGLGLRGV